MTREDELYADELRDRAYSDYERLDLAIQALEAQPTDEIKEAYLKGYDYGVKDWFKSKTQPCEDAVSREQVEEITFQEPSYTDPYNILTEVREKVRALSSVTPERPKGKWIDVNGDKSLFECSKCGDKVCCANNNYCPNCGAEMEGGEE